MNALTPLEEQVVRMLLSGEHSALSILRHQVEQAAISSRETTGVGFFTRFAVPSDVPRIPGEAAFQLTDVCGAAANITHGVGFVLFVKNGAIDFLEGFTYDEPWPDEIKSLTLSYCGDGTRNMERVRREISGARPQ